MKQLTLLGDGTSSWLMICLSLMVLSSTAGAEPTLVVDLDEQVDAALDLLSAGDLEEGIALLEGILASFEDPVRQSHLRYLMARAEQEAGSCERAMVRYLSLESAANDDDPWLPRARFGRAECLMQLGEPESAMDLFAAQAEQLLEPARRIELAEILDNYARDAAELRPWMAYSLYDLVRTLEPGGELQERAEHSAAMCALVAGNTSLIIARLNRDPSGPWACAERLALANHTRHNPGLWQVVRNCDADTAIEAARQLYTNNAGPVGVAALEAALVRFPEHSQVPQLRALLALGLIEFDDLERAWEVTSQALAGEQAMDIDQALSFAQLFARRGGGEEARRLWERIRENTTRSSDFDTIRAQWIVLRMREIAEAYHTGAVDRALELLQQLALEVPTESARTLTIRGQILARAERWEEAEVALRAARTNQAKRYLVAILEGLGELERAHPIRQELGLTGRQEHLQVAIQNTFRFGEPPQLLLETDALSQIELRFHFVDVEAHFRSMGTLGRLDQLDVDLIAPHVTRAVELAAPTFEGYRQPGPVSQIIDLGSLSAGVYALQVVGETRQATTLVTVSDLALVARQVMGDLVVMVFNRTSGEVVSEARVLVTDGRRIVAEGRTDSSGLFAAQVPPSSLEVLAIHGDDSAWMELPGVSGSSASEQREILGQQRQSRLFIDRTEALAGEQISYLALITEGEAPRRLLDDEVQVCLTAAAQAIECRERPVRGGLVNGQIDLPASLPDGLYTLLVGTDSRQFRVGSETSQGSQLRLFQPEPAEVGGVAEVVVDMRGSNDLPAIGFEISGDLGDGQGQRILGLTDEEGRLLLHVPVLKGLAPPTVRIDRQHHTVTLVDEPSPTLIGLPDIRPNQPSAVALSWGGGRDARAFARLTHLPSEMGETLPINPPLWWPDLPQQRSGRLIWNAETQLQSGAGVIMLPPLEVGTYQLTLDLLRDDGFRSSNGQLIEVVAEGSTSQIVVPRLNHQADQPLRLQVEQALELSIQSPGQYPMLLTLEGMGLLLHKVVRDGQDLALTLPEGLVGEASFVLSGLVARAEEQQEDALARLEVEVAHQVSVLSEVTTSPDTRLEIVLADGRGQPVFAPVFVSVLPVERQSEDLTQPLFPLQSMLLPGYTGVSRLLDRLVESREIDHEILDLQAEARFAELALDLIEMEAWEYDSLDGYGSYGIGGFGMAGGGMGLVQSMGTSSGGYAIRFPHEAVQSLIAQRRHPLVWTMTQTDAEGRLSLTIDRELLDRGWYELRVVTLDQLGISSNDEQPNTTGDRGTLYQRTIWIEQPRIPPARPEEPVWANYSDTRRILHSGERLRLDLGDSQWLVLEVAEPSIDSLVSVLLAPDRGLAWQKAFFGEQLQALRSIQTNSPSHPIRVESGPPGLMPWIAEVGTHFSPGTLPLSTANQSQILLEIERLGEDQLRQRAEALLGLGRLAPGHTQGLAALQRLQRTESARSSEVVGTLALATIALENGNISQALGLIPDLMRAAVDGSLFARARAMEALRSMGQPLPLDPRALLEDLTSREGMDSVLALGSIVRTLLMDEEARTLQESRLVVEIEGQGRLELGPGRTVIALATQQSQAELLVQGGTTALRVNLVSQLCPGNSDYRLERKILRQGPWFRGLDILPDVVDQPEAVTAGVVGHLMRVQLSASAPSTAGRHEVSVEEFLPPGGQLVEGSLSGATILNQGNGRLLLRANLQSSHEIVYTVELQQATHGSAHGLPTVDSSWPSALLRAEDGSCLAISDGSTFTVNDAEHELRARLAGQVIWPNDDRNLGFSESLRLGLVVQRSVAGDPELNRLALELLLPQLHSGRLTSTQVAEAGAAAFRAALVLEDDDTIEDVFSILEARAPSVGLTQADLHSVARMFHRRGELAYAMRAYRALLNLRFLTEASVGEGLNGMGYTSVGIRLVHDLTRAYPDIPSVVDSMFNLPQLMLNQAQNLPETPEGRFNARRFRRTASRWLSEYLVRYGTEERAAQAALIQLNTLRWLDAWPRLVRLSSAMEQRYGLSEFVDSYMFMRAYAHQRLSHMDQAQILYQRLVDEEFLGRPSSDRSRARLAIAQIHHARGELEEAVTRYREVESEFDDARAALATIEHAELRVPSVVETMLDESLLLPVRVRGVEDLRIWVYAVDLERLFLREKQVRAVENISLAGIEPVAELELTLRANYGTLSDHLIELGTLPEGAYLVLLRGPTVRASTLAIITNLRLDIVEDAGMSVLHISVTDHEGVPQEGARVRVAGRFADRTERGETDLRGLVRLSGYDRHAHLLARVGDSYAVYRGVEQDAYALPSQIHSGFGSASTTEDALMEGQEMRINYIQLDNEAVFQQNVLRNPRRSSSIMLY